MKDAKKKESKKEVKASISKEEEKPTPAPQVAPQQQPSLKLKIKTIKPQAAPEKPAEDSIDDELLLAVSKPKEKPIEAKTQQPEPAKKTDAAPKLITVKPIESKKEVVVAKPAPKELMGSAKHKSTSSTSNTSSNDKIAIQQPKASPPKPIVPKSSPKKEPKQVNPPKNISSNISKFIPDVPLSSLPNIPRIAKKIDKQKEQEKLEKSTLDAPPAPTTSLQVAIEPSKTEKKEQAAAPKTEMKQPEKPHRLTVSIPQFSVPATPPPTPASVLTPSFELASNVAAPTMQQIATHLTQKHVALEAMDIEPAPISMIDQNTTMVHPPQREPTPPPPIVREPTPPPREPTPPPMIDFFLPSINENASDTTSLLPLSNPLFRDDDEDTIMHDADSITIANANNSYHEIAVPFILQHSNDHIQVCLNINDKYNETDAEEMQQWEEYVDQKAQFRSKNALKNKIVPICMQIESPVLEAHKSFDVTVQVVSELDPHMIERMKNLQYVRLGTSSNFEYFLLFSMESNLHKPLEKLISYPLHHASMFMCITKKPSRLQQAHAFSDFQSHVQLQMQVRTGMTEPERLACYELGKRIDTCKMYIANQSAMFFHPDPKHVQHVCNEFGFVVDEQFAWYPEGLYMQATNEMHCTLVQFLVMHNKCAMRLMKQNQFLLQCNM